MPKIRGFKADLWTDEDFVELSPWARLLWMGMWNYACDNGHLADKSKQIKMRVLPTDDVNCADLLREIATQGLIERADGWITIPNLTRHQKPDRRYFTTCEKEGCDEPPETSSQRAARRAHTGRTPDARGVHAFAHVDGDGEVKGSEVIRASAGAERENDAADDFDLWWTLYPRKRGKGQAVKAYRAARKKATAEQLLTSLRSQLAEMTAKGDQFTPYPATWLNGERWLDQPAHLAVVADPANLPPVEQSWMRRRPE